MADPTEGFYVPGTRLSDIEDQTIQWISPGRLAVGEIAMLDGDPGLGKSTLLTDWVARLTTGRPILGGDPHPPAGVVLLSGEDHLAATIRPRMRAAGADLSRVLYLNRVPNIGLFPGVDGETHPVSLPGDLPYIELACRNAEAKLLVVDPIMLYFDESVNTNSDGSVRRALDGLKAMAERMKFAVVLVRHLNKLQTGPAMYRGQGSIAFSAASRVGMVLGEHPDEEGSLVLAVYKCNNARKPPSVTFRIEPDPDNLAVGRVVYGEENRINANDLTGYITPEERQERQVCRAWMESVLRYGEHEHKDLYKRASAAGFNATLTRSMLASINAQRSLAGEKTLWSLPRDPEPTGYVDVPWDEEVRA
jgi:hypothetical protein